MTQDKCVRIPLTKDRYAILDEIDSDLAELKWYVQYHETGNGFYAQRQTRVAVNKQRPQMMHDVVLARKLGRPLLEHEESDHINHDTLDNRRSNLRVATREQNMQNRRKQSNNTSGYKGVSWHKTRSRWQARIAANNKNYFLGFFDNAEEAARAYDTAAQEFHGEFAVLNFPRPTDTTGQPLIAEVSHA